MYIALNENLENCYYNNKKKTYSRLTLMRFDDLIGTMNIILHKKKVRVFIHKMFFSKPTLFYLCIKNRYKLWCLSSEPSHNHKKSTDQLKICEHKKWPWSDSCWSRYYIISLSGNKCVISFGQSNAEVQHFAPTILIAHLIEQQPAYVDQTRLSG